MVGMLPGSPLRGSATICGLTRCDRLIAAAGKRCWNPERDVVLLRLIYQYVLRAKEARLAR